MGRITIKSLQDEIKIIASDYGEAKEELLKAEEFQKRIEEILFNRDFDECGLNYRHRKPNKEELIYKLKEKMELIKDYEGTINKVNETLREENSKLWYMLRVFAKDKSTEKIVFRPGDQNHPDMLDIKRPFRN